MATFRTISPVDGSVLLERPYATAAALDRVLIRAVRAQQDWRRTPLDQRIAAVTALVEAVSARTDALAEELTRQMGRPIAQAPGELAGFADRAHTMLRLAPEALADEVMGPKEGFTRFIRHEPLGVVLVLSPWNYPWLTAVNVLVPALVAGNAVVLKHAEQTPRVAERLSEAAAAAGLPDGVLQHVHATHDQVADLVRDGRVAHVAFTGSVAGGVAVHRAAGGTFKTVGLELGGNDPAYVRADADVEATAAALVDGACFNAGQSCCAVERVYVHADVADAFLDAAVAAAEGLVLGDPMDPSTTLGPVARVDRAQAIRAVVDAAVAGGARALLDPSRFGDLPEPYVAPQILTDLDPRAEALTEETFGPVMPVVVVRDDDDAVARMNADRYGLTASIWSRDVVRATELGSALDTGTVFLNRCDALDPELPWVGVKDSGRGVTLSRHGYGALTRLKAFHLRHAVPG